MEDLIGRIGRWLRNSRLSRRLPRVDSIQGDQALFSMIECYQNMRRLSRLYKPPEADPNAPLHPLHPMALPKPAQIIQVDCRPKNRPKIDPSRPLRLLTWNIERGYKLDAIIEELRGLDADVLALQVGRLYCPQGGTGI